MPNADTIAHRLRAAREAKGLTRQEVSDAAGVPSGTLIRWESGANAPKPVDLAKLALLYQVSADYLLGIQDQPRVLVPGFFLVDQDFVEQLLATRDSSEISELCDSRRGALVDFGTIIRDGARVVDPSEGQSIERQVVAHVASHGKGGLRKAFSDYSDSEGASSDEVGN